jgi:hypothetical protein
VCGSAGRLVLMAEYWEAELEFYESATAELLHELDRFRPEFKDMPLEAVLARLEQDRLGVMDLEDDDEL